MSDVRRSGTNVRDYVHAQTGLAHADVASDRDLLRKLIENIGDGLGPFPRWSHVSALVGHGSGVSQAICRALDLDPDEVIGDFVCPVCDDLPNDETPPENA